MFKPRRQHIKNLSVDMAAMCDVAFLILIFFVLTAKPVRWIPIRIDLPFASNHMGDPDDNEEGGILIGHGKVAFEISDSKVRKQTLLQMGEKYHIKFSPSEISKFGKIDIIAVPISELKQYIDEYFTTNSFFNQSGIPFNSNNHELANWIYESRKACKALYDKDLSFTVNADEKTTYPQIASVIQILNRQAIYKFGLITNLKRLKK
jgi:biopolymer transport protein ExbD